MEGLEDELLLLAGNARPSVADSQLDPLLMEADPQLRGSPGVALCILEEVAGHPSQGALIATDGDGVSPSRNSEAGCLLPCKRQELDEPKVLFGAWVGCKSTDQKQVFNELVEFLDVLLRLAEKLSPSGI